MAWVSEGDLEAGLTEFHRVLVNDPDYVAAYFQMGQALTEAGRTPDAREILVRGIAAARRVGDTHAQAEMAGFLETLGT